MRAATSSCRRRSSATFAAAACRDNRPAGAFDGGAFGAFCDGTAGEFPTEPCGGGSPAGRGRANQKISATTIAIKIAQWWARIFESILASYGKLERVASHHRRSHLRHSRGCLGRPL